MIFQPEMDLMQNIKKLLQVCGGFFHIMRRQFIHNCKNMPNILQSRVLLKRQSPSQCHCTMAYNSCHASCGHATIPEEYKFYDPFKAVYPNKGLWVDPNDIKNIQKFHENFNCYNKHTRQTRYQFSLHNKLIWVSSDSALPKLHGKKRRVAWGESKGQINSQLDAII